MLRFPLSLPATGDFPPCGDFFFYSPPAGHFGGSVPLHGGSAVSSHYFVPSHDHLWSDIICKNTLKIGLFGRLLRAHPHACAQVCAPVCAPAREGCRPARVQGCPYLRAPVGGSLPPRGTAGQGGRSQKENLFAALDRRPKCWYNKIGKLRDMGDLPWQQKQKKNTATKVFPP